MATLATRAPKSKRAPKRAQSQAAPQSETRPTEPSTQAQPEEVPPTAKSQEPFKPCAQDPKYKAAERRALEKRTTWVVYDKEGFASLGDLLANAFSPISSDEPIARGQLFLLSEELYALSQAVLGDEFMSMTPSILERVLLGMSCRARVAVEIDARIERHEASTQRHDPKGGDK
jgi:hypothetical protein